MKPAIRCPSCGWDIGAALNQGDEYCPRCGFELTRCVHCGADARQTLRTEEQVCDACQQYLKPKAPSLPDDAFWNSTPGQLIHVLILVGILATGMFLGLGLMALVLKSLK